MYFDDVKSFEKAYYKSAGIVLGFMGISVLSVLTISSCAKQNNIRITRDDISWDEIKNSYVGLVEEDGVYEKRLLKTKGNGIYRDLLYDATYFDDEVLEYYDAIPYFVQTDNVKSGYSKEELNKIIQEFKIGSDEYKYSDHYVKVMK